MSPNVPAILGVLRHATIAGRSPLLLSDVEALEEVVHERAALLQGLKDFGTHSPACPCTREGYSLWGNGDEKRCECRLGEVIRKAGAP